MHRSTDALVDRPPCIIGIYGLPGAGKTTTLSQLRLMAWTMPSHYDYYEGSELIDSLVDGGLAAFKQLPPQQQHEYRTAAIKQVGDNTRARGRNALVTGHLMLPRRPRADTETALTDLGSGGDAADLLNGLAEVCTDADLNTYTHIVYLKVDPAVISRQRSGDAKRSRAMLGEEELGRWQDAELERLFGLCLEYGILFSVVTPQHGAAAAERISRLCYFWETNAALNSEVARCMMPGLVAARMGLSSRLVVLDADRTLAAADSTLLFLDAAAPNGYLGHSREDMGRVLRSIFSGPLGYSHHAFQQVTLLLEDVLALAGAKGPNADTYDAVCSAVAERITMHREMVEFLTCAVADPFATVVVATCGVRRVWEKVLAREGLGMIHVVGGGRVEDDFVVTPMVKADVVSGLLSCSQLQPPGELCQALVFGDSPLDIPMMAHAHHAFVVVGDEGVRSTTMDDALKKAIDDGLFDKHRDKEFKTNIAQVLLPPTATPRPGLSVVELEFPMPLPALAPDRLEMFGSSLLDMVLNVASLARAMRQHEQRSEASSSSSASTSTSTSSSSTRSSDDGCAAVPVRVVAQAAGQLLATPMRDASISGPALQEAHRQVGHYLATQLVTEELGLEEIIIPHVQGGRTAGHRLKDEAKTLIVAMMRGGEPMAMGAHVAFPSAVFLHAKRARDVDSEHVQGMANILLVDSVVNTGKSILHFVKHIRSVNVSARIVIVAGVVQAKAIEALGDAEGESLREALASYGDVTMVALRVSENQFSGTGTTDTGNRLFNTTHLD